MMERDGTENKGLKVFLPMANLQATAPRQEDAPTAPPSLDQTFVDGTVECPAGKVPRVSSSLTWRDLMGTVRARIGAGRMHYFIDPGLYALGKPDEGSAVLVTANYKLSFDSLREALPGRNAWILVLDTRGINVWCAAGKGTFGTDELIRRIVASGLKSVVSHRDLVLPQLGAPGVAAHLVKKLSGFRVHYGPVQARDLPAYLEAGFKATPRMRRKDFPLKDRAVLIPIELISALKPGAVAAVVMFFLAGLLPGFSSDRGFVGNLLGEGIFSAAAVFLAVVAGCVLTPLLLPFIPGRAFSFKGFIMGGLTGLLLLYLAGYDVRSLNGMLAGIAWLMMMSSVAAYLAMNFTGSSTYTSLSGVRKEMRWALPLQIGTGTCGIALRLVSGFIS